MKVQRNIQSLVLNLPKRQRYEEIHDLIHSEELKTTLPKMHIGSGYYEWTLGGNESEWNQLSNASGIESSQVQKAFEQRLQEIRLQLSNIPGLNGSIDIDKILCYPSASHIYYRQIEESNFQFVITAWGCKYSQKPNNGSGEYGLNKKEDIKLQKTTILITCAGIPVPDYSFTIQDGEKFYKWTTDAQGMFYVGKLPIGNTYTIIPAANVPPQSITISEGNPQYPIDVTENTQIQISVIHDNLPIAGKEVFVSYNKNLEAIRTDSNGSVSISVDYIEGEECTVTIDGKNETLPIAKPSTFFIFATTTPVEMTDIVITVSQGSQPLPEKTVILNYDGNTKTIQTDARGKVHVSTPYKDGVIVKVNVENISVEQPLQKPSTLIHIDIPAIPPEQVKQIANVYLKIEGNDSFIGKSYPILVEVNGQSRKYISDNNGIVPLGEVVENTLIRVTDGIIPKNTQDITTIKSQQEYIFHIPFSAVLSNQDIKISVTEWDSKPVTDCYIHFTQEGTNGVLAWLENEGIAWLDKTDFSTERPINITLSHQSRQFEPINFKLDPQETEYQLIVNGGKRNFLFYLGQILLSITALTACSVIFNVFTKFLLQ